MGKEGLWKDPKTSRHEAKRGLRAGHKKRMKAKAVKIRRSWFTTQNEENLVRNAIKIADNLAVCSCWMCGNARKHFGPSLSEKRAFAAHDYED